VLVVSALFEGWSFAVGFREYKRVIRGRDIPLWSFIKASKDPSLYGTPLEDFSAFIGIAIAALGVIASSLLHIGWADGAASIAIGLLLVGVSAVLANETRSLIAGEAVAGPIMEELHRVLAADSRILQIDEIATMHLGPQAIFNGAYPALSIGALDSSLGRRNTGNHFYFASGGETCRLCLCPARAQRSAPAEANPPNGVDDCSKQLVENYW